MHLFFNLFIKRLGSHHSRYKMATYRRPLPGSSIPRRSPVVPARFREIHIAVIHKVVIIRILEYDWLLT